KIIRPAVVNIKVERQVVVPGISFNDPLDFFSQMFGQRFHGRHGPFRMPSRPQIQMEGQQGSGVIIDPSGYILTNNHVVGNADTIRVLLLDGREFTAELIGTDPGTEIAVIKIDAPNLTMAKFGDSDDIEVGEWVIAVGNPFGFDFTVTSGIVSARGRSGFGLLDVEDFIQTDASINPGNSGGPLVNLRGEVIGINTFIRTQSGGSIGIGFAVPSNIAKNIMQSLIAHKQVTASYLGVESQTMDRNLAEHFGLRSSRGALINAVSKDSPAEKAGFRRGDIVLRWGRREIADDQQLRNLVIITPPGEPVEVEVFREGETIQLLVTLVPTPPEMAIEGRTDRFLQSLGIEVTDITPQLLIDLGYESTAEGVLVSSVLRGTPAAQLGLMPGSIIINLNGNDVKSVQELKNAIVAAERSKTYDLVWRNGGLLRRARLTGD
ncbi:MAG: Do family serine endopeptidase, partial [Planctomycetes bacterium]|nr:Do family serine endopeptidase [Planctomycetota bacterium]